MVFVDFDQLCEVCVRHLLSAVYQQCLTKFCCVFDSNLCYFMAVTVNSYRVNWKSCGPVICGVQRRIDGAIGMSVMR